MRTIPVWLNCEKWLAMDQNQRWNGAQAIVLMCGLSTQNTWMAAVRGIPGKPPPFVIEEKWEAVNDIASRNSEVIELEAHAAFEVAIAMRATFDRAETIKTCKHTFVGAPGVLTEACVKCGHVRAVDTRRKPLTA